MLESYRYYNNLYKNTLILFKSGSFYTVLYEDALIFNKIFRYKVNFAKNFIKVGFPINSEIKILNILEKANINYIILEKDSSFFNVILNKKFNNNKYKNYLVNNINNILYNKSKIDKIYDKLLNKLINEDINSVLESINSLL